MLLQIQKCFFLRHRYNQTILYKIIDAPMPYFCYCASSNLRIDLKPKYFQYQNIINYLCFLKYINIHVRHYYKVCTEILEIIFLFGNEQ